MRDVQPLRVISKAAIILAAANLCFAFFNPPLGRLSIYNWMVPGRLRLPFADPGDERLGYSLMVYEDFEAMFAAHVISQPKPPDEYRVVLLGDSAVWGYNLGNADTVAEQINDRGLVVCGRKVRAHNLGYVGLGVARDLLLLERALPHRPDMILWFVTLKSLGDMGRANVQELLQPQAEQALRLISAYRLAIDTSYLRLPVMRERSLLGQRARLKKLAVLQLDGLLWSATGLDFHVTELPAMDSDQTDDPALGRNRSGQLDREELLTGVLDAGFRMAGPTPVLVVNEPIFIATGENHDVRYDVYYPRWAYDQYRAHLAEWMSQRGRPYLDLWDAVPPSEFGETPLHLTAQGASRLSEVLARQLADRACP
jgi:lysophospholipase L1-like esterase